MSIDQRSACHMFRACCPAAMCLFTPREGGWFTVRAIVDQGRSRDAGRRGGKGCGGRVQGTLVLEKVGPSGIHWNSLVSGKLHLISVSPSPDGRGYQSEILVDSRLVAELPGRSDREVQTIAVLSNRCDHARVHEFSNIGKWYIFS